MIAQIDTLPDLSTHVLAVATAATKRAGDGQWTPSTMTWGDIVTECQSPEIRSEKDGAVWFFGDLSAPRRIKDNVTGRSAITLDIDDPDDTIWSVDELIDNCADVFRVRGLAAIVHKTFRGNGLRIIVPTATPIEPSRYADACQAVEGWLDMDAREAVDPTCRSVAQLMQRPSTPDRDTYHCAVAEGALLDWTTLDIPGEPADKPVEARGGVCGAPGLVGLVNRTFTVDEAVERFDLPYTHVSGDRWLFNGSKSGQAGARVLDDGFGLWSDHGTDPACTGQAHGTFDLVRLHRFGGDQNATLEFFQTVPEVQRRALDEDFGDDYSDWEPEPPAQSKSLSADDPWTPVDLATVLADDYSPRVPSLLQRTDGQCFLYKGLTHSIQGESGSGKSLIVQAECARILKDGGRVLYLDFESGPGEVVRGRLMDTFGCTVAQVTAGLTYIRPDGPPKGEGFEALCSQPFDLAVIDGVTEALGCAGLSGDNLTNSNDALTLWHRRLPRRLADETGAAVVMIDHVTKSTDGRAFAIGGQAKRAALTGASYTVELVKPFSRGVSGELRICLAKDREGQVPRGPMTKAGAEVGRVIVDAHADGTVDLSIAPPDPEPSPQERAEGVCEAVAFHLAQEGKPVSLNQLRKAVGGRAKSVDAAVESLTARGFVEETKGARNARMFRLVKPFTPDFEDDIWGSENDLT